MAYRPRLVLVRVYRDEAMSDLVFEIPLDDAGLLSAAAYRRTTDATIILKAMSRVRALFKEPAESFHYVVARGMQIERASNSPRLASPYPAGQWSFEEVGAGNSRTV